MANISDLIWITGTTYYSRILRGGDSGEQIRGYDYHWYLVFAGGGDDVIFCDGGNDTIYGQGGHDDLVGREGHDTLAGGKDNDWLYGGEGADTFVFAAGDGSAHVADFEAGETIRISGVPGGFAGLVIEQVGDNAVIRYGDGDKITLRGVSADSLGADDFLLA